MENPLEKAIGEKWYAQACNTTPLFLMSAGLSGFSMRHKAGVSYSHFLFECHGTFGKICYSINDLERMNKELLESVRKDKDHFKKLRTLYDKEQKISRLFYKKIDSLDLSAIEQKDIHGYVLEGIKAIDRAVGIAHVIEPFALIEDAHIKEDLKKYISNPKELNESFIALTTPAHISFIQESEELLLKIKNASLKKPLIEKYLSEFYWARNTYVGRYRMTAEEIEKEAGEIKIKARTTSIDVEKKKILSKYSLDADLKARLGYLEFMTGWQDDRKKNILLGIDYLDRLIELEARETKIPYDLIKYMAPHELESGIRVSESQLKKRKKAVVFYMTGDKDYVFLDHDYKKICDSLEHQHTSEIKILNGVAASLGTAIGKVRICTTIDSLSKVEEGDILVTSMTRPEYLPAMKKAAAFVTDEGGITCHAAIVAREMGKPCVIGTKIATHVLKDGDLVEVKGNHGTVVIRETTS